MVSPYMNYRRVHFIFYNTFVNYSIILNISNVIRYLNYDFNYYICNNGDILRYVLYLNACILYY